MQRKLRAHYLEIYDGNVFSISGEGKTIYFDKNFLTNSLKYEDLPNNIEEILKNDYKLIGIRDFIFIKSSFYFND